MVKIREDLVGVTIVRDGSGRDHILSAGDKVPSDVKVGDHLLSKKDAGATSSAPAQSPAPATTPEPTPAAPDNPIPPKGGAGSGADAWRAYAIAEVQKRGLNIEIPADASRVDIITALDESKIPTE